MKQLLAIFTVLAVVASFNSFAFAQDSDTEKPATDNPAPNTDPKAVPPKDDAPTLNQLWNDYQNALDLVLANTGPMVRYHAQLLEFGRDLTDMQKEKINECGMYYARMYKLGKMIEGAFMDEENRDDPEVRKWLSVMIGKFQIHCMMVRNLLIELDKELPYPQETMDKWRQDAEDWDPMSDDKGQDAAPETKPDSDEDGNK